MVKKNKALAKKRHFISSFYYAGKGLRIAFLKGQNIRIFIIIAVLVLLAGYFLQVSVTEWLVLIFAISVTFVS